MVFLHFFSLLPAGGVLLLNTDCADIRKGRSLYAPAVFPGVVAFSFHQVQIVLVFFLKQVFVSLLRGPPGVPISAEFRVGFQW